MKWSGDYDNRVEMTFQNSAENEIMGRTAAASFAAVLNPTIEELSDFKTAVSEAVTNAIIHAYPKRTGQIKMVLKRKGHTIQVQVTDYGVGIADVEKCMEPLYTSCPLSERSGMGFTFMEAFSDEIKVSSKPAMGTTILLTKTMGKEEKLASDL